MVSNEYNWHQITEIDKDIDHEKKTENKCNDIQWLNYKIIVSSQMYTSPLNITLNSSTAGWEAPD